VEKRGSFRNFGTCGKGRCRGLLGDETGVSNCETVERGFTAKGHLPILPVETKRESVNMISAISI